jgi:predicted GNAT family N-acyltransferase
VEAIAAAPPTSEGVEFLPPRRTSLFADLVGGVQERSGRYPVAFETCRNGRAQFRPGRQKGGHRPELPWKSIPNGVPNDWEEKMLTFRVADTKYDHGWCVLIRTLAFEVEQKVDFRLEIDEYENSSRHILCLDNDSPCATARWRHYRPGIVKIERVAVLKSSRGSNIGSTLMQHVMSDALANASNCLGFSLNAQEYAVSFYKRLGFQVIGEPFLDANIVHYAMER